MTRRPIEYAVRQSTDEDAFDPLPPTPAPLRQDRDRSRTNSQTVKASPPQASIKTTRQAALADVVRQAQTKEGTGKMRGKVGIITGVGPLTGIGTATARLMAREGASHLYLLDFVETQLQDLAASLRKDFPGFTTVTADAASSSAISGLVDRAISEEGHLDFFFANAGISQLRPKGDVQYLEMLQRLTRTAVDIPEEEYTEIMRINALSVFLAVKYAAPALSKVCPEKGKNTPGGSLVLTASIAGLKSNAGPMAYSASKAAVVSMAQTASYELAGRNIRVNAICPGLIQTDMTKGLFDLAEMGGKTDKMGSINPMMRQGLAHEVAQLATFLASDDASYVNGQAIACDGGLTSGVPYVPMRMSKL